MTSLPDTTFLLGQNGQERLERLARTLDAIDEGLQIISADWRYLYLNLAAARHGRKPRADLLGLTMQQAYPGIENTALFERLARGMKERKVDSMVTEFEFADGKKGWFELRIEPHEEGLIIFSIDITERKLLEQQYLHAQKLEAVGRLAGGVAHDFNNLLSVILSYTQIVIDDAPNGQPRDDLLEVFSAAQRAAQLSKQLLSFSRNQVMQARLLDLNDVLLGLTRMLRPLVGEDVVMRVRTAAQPLVLKGDSGLLEQVVMNLVVNARDAMPEGGELLLELEKVGDCAELVVRDTGVGMDETTRERIFEPFFTTKQLGKGTGLGLCTVFSIVSQLGGTVRVESSPGAGSSFVVKLPLAPPGATPSAPEHEPLSVKGPTGQSVLVVDDDVQLLNLVCTVLKQAGYVVLRAQGGAEALRLATESQVDLLLTDAVMPGMSGSELASQMRGLRPGLRVLFMSGYADEGLLRQRELGGGAELIEKPLLPAQLLERVRLLFARQSPAAVAT